MPRLTRVIPLAVLGFVGLLVLAAAALLFFVDTQVHKARVEAIASKTLGMEVRIGGRLGISFFPELLLTLGDVRVRNRGVDVAFAKEARLAIGLRPLFERQVRIETIALRHARISIERGRDGEFNVEPPQASAGTLPAMDWQTVSLSDGTFVYADQRLGEQVQGADCRVLVQRLSLAAGDRSNLMKNISFTAELACRQVRSGGGFTVSDLKLSAVAKNGLFDLKPVTAHVFGTPGSGSIEADFSGAVPRYRVRYAVAQFPVEEFFKALSARKVAAGRMDFAANLSMQGSTRNQIRQTLKGQISLRGKHLTLSGSDLDQEFARFESSQNFNLVDAGAFFLAGPLGLVVTKGVDFASLLQATGGSSEIRALVSDWKVERGVAHAQDVAMATNENRIALRGGLDFVHHRFDDVTLALVDTQGCAKLRQKIRGSFGHPVVENPGALESLAGPAMRLLKRARDLFPGARCEVFYAGSVAAPK